MADRMLLDGPAIAADLGLHPVTIRNWASAGHIVRYGTDHRGRALYDYDDVEAWATRHSRDVALGANDGA